MTVNGIYGHRRIRAELTAMGQACGRPRVARLTREAACVFVRENVGGWNPAVATICRLHRII
ncbi:MULTISPECIES: IS3 family transposase [unclassified Pseudomonas]|uniref:Transposase n=2 Tax=Pseudomonadaceae TaxID=135621 RepID=A0A5R8ZU20_PSENT|nr:transposase [Pseudomonas sp. PDM19]MBD9684137.1 transposase [Pseudomonas sp. PDM20]QEY72003.1 transposase [Pseudomonas denitrificans (nom. rej.)]TLP69800.1 transposase [Pseudomonas nitroreducens]